MDELRSLVTDKEAKTPIKLVLLLDAYDEIPPDSLGKNLYRTNNLEQFNVHKIIFTARSELFGDPKYHQRQFYPREMKNPLKDEVLFDYS